MSTTEFQESDIVSPQRSQTVGSNRSHSPIQIENRDRSEQTLQPHVNEYVNRLRAEGFITPISRQTLQEREITECSICRDSFNDEAEAPVQLRCDHIFGRACIEEWLSEGNDCPNRCESSARRRGERDTSIDRELDDMRTQTLEEVREHRYQMEVREYREQMEGTEQDLVEREEERLMRERLEQEREAETRDGRPVNSPDNLSVRHQIRSAQPSRAQQDIPQGDDDWLSSYLGCLSVEPGVQPPSGYVISEDRLFPGDWIYKKVIKCFQREGNHYLLLRSPARNEEYPDSYTYDLELEYYFPNAKDDLGVVSWLGDLNMLNGLSFHDLHWIGVATFEQGISLLGPFTLIGLEINGFDRWFDQKMIEDKYGVQGVQSKVWEERVQRRQAEPILQREDPFSLHLLEEIEQRMFELQF